MEAVSGPDWGCGGAGLGQRGTTAGDNRDWRTGLVGKRGRGPQGGRLRALRADGRSWPPVLSPPRPCGTMVVAAMFEHAIVNNLLPETFVHQLMTQPRGTFFAGYGHEAFVLVELAEQRDELEAGLYACLPEDMAGRAQRLVSIALHSSEHSAKSSGDGVATPIPPPAEPTVVEKLRARVRDKTHFIVPLRKRDAADTYSARVTVGRARNMDIMLRHGSISKLHGWFERGKRIKGFCATDAGSKNGTAINGQPVRVRNLVELAAGDLVRFGSVAMRYCPAEALLRLVIGE